MTLQSSPASARFSTVMNRINEGRKARTLEEMEKELRVMAYRGEWTVRALGSVSGESEEDRAKSKNTGRGNDSRAWESA